VVGSSWSGVVEVVVYLGVLFVLASGVIGLIARTQQPDAIAKRQLAGPLFRVTAGLTVLVLLVFAR
jgi:NADH:ubiquinone oxidoreductase subunit 6 (subunit J)